MTPRRQTAESAARGKTTTALAPAFVPPYPPSWFDRFSDWVDRLPGPPWVFYLLSAALVTALLLVAAASTGDYRPGPFLSLHVWLATQLVYMLGLMHYLDRSAGSALDSFRPVLEGGGPAKTPTKVDDPTFADLRYRLTTLPRWPAWLASLAGLAFGLLLPFLFLATQPPEGRTLSAAFAGFGFPASSSYTVLILAYVTLTEAVSGTLLFHTVRQLGLISHIYASPTRLNLYRLQPLYAFSVPAGLTAAGLVLFTYAWFATAPTLFFNPVGIRMGVFFLAIAATTFAWPLLGIHRRLLADKKRLMFESSERFEATVAELHRRVDEKALTAMDDLNKTLESLEIEQAALRRIPTWPWEPGALRGVVAALVLPIVIWLIQYGLQRFLG